MIPPTSIEHLSHPQYRADIDGLRGIAVLSVVGFHVFPSWIKGGFIGVDVFFVISGYLISTIIIGNLERNSFSFVEFYSRRIKRIFPALLLVLIASFALGWFALLADAYKQLGKHIAGGAGFISNFLLWNESGYFDNAAETKPLLHLWSLGVEEQFYIIWPLFLWLAWKLHLNLILIAIAIGSISFVLNVVAVNGDTVAAFYTPQTRFWELMVGSLLAHNTLHKHNIFPKFKRWLDMLLAKIIYTQTPGNKGATLRNIQSAFGIVLIAIGVLIITKERQFPGWWAVLPTLGTLLIISAGSEVWLNRAVLSHRVLVWIGLISFPLYLWHWPMLSFARIIQSETPSWEIRIAITLVSIVLAWLTYILIEKPIRFGNYSKAKTITLAVLMGLVGYTGYNCYKHAGLPSRFPEVVQELTQLKGNNVGEWRLHSCFLSIEQNYSAFNACELQPAISTKQSLLLWGDSHAAHLYPGYKISFGEKYKIIQRTISACPPILNMVFIESPHCKEINNHIFEFIKNERPNKVVLAAVWVNYDWKKIEGTIAQLHNIGIKDIDIIGPVPQWKDSLPKQLYLKYISDKFHSLPYRMTFGLNRNFIQLEPLLNDLATKSGVNYISPMRILCDELGCITRFGDTGDKLTAWDNGHLTGIGSRFLVSQFPK